MQKFSSSRRRLSAVRRLSTSTTSGSGDATAAISTRLQVLRMKNSCTPRTRPMRRPTAARSSAGRWNGARLRDGRSASDVPSTTSSRFLRSASMDAISSRKSRAAVQLCPLVDTETSMSPERTIAGVVKSPSDQLPSAQQHGTCTVRASSRMARLRCLSSVQANTMRCPATSPARNGRFVQRMRPSPDHAESSSTASGQINSTFAPTSSSCLTLRRPTCPPPTTRAAPPSTMRLIGNVFLLGLPSRYIVSRGYGP